jgi:putative transposase
MTDEPSPMDRDGLVCDYKHWRNYSDVGSVCFVTTTVQAHTPLFTDRELVGVLIGDLEFYRAKHGFGLVAFTIMPDHVHLLLWLQGTGSVSKIMGEWKSHTSKRILEVLRTRGNERELRLFRARGPADSKAISVWERSFRSYAVLSGAQFRTKFDYVHTNAVRRGLCAVACEYPYSSARNY